MISDNRVNGAVLQAFFDSVNIGLAAEGRVNFGISAAFSYGSVSERKVVCGRFGSYVHALLFGAPD
jgi:hypothetical protein